MVTSLVLRMPDRKDTLGHSRRACLERNGTIPLGDLFEWKNDRPSALKQREGGSLVWENGTEQLYPNRLYHGSAIMRPTRVG